MKQIKHIRTHSTAVEITNKDNISSIIDVLYDYLAALGDADETKLARVFHPDARYVNGVPNTYSNLSMPEYFEIVARRTPCPAVDGPKNDRILSIELGSDNIANVRLVMTLMGREYWDYLTLVNFTGNWLIINKIFHSNEIQTSETRCLT